MSRLSRMVQTLPTTQRLPARLALMSGLLLIVLVAFFVARMQAPARVVAPVPAEVAPSSHPAPPTGLLHAGIRTDNGTVNLALREPNPGTTATPEKSSPSLKLTPPPPDNLTAAAPRPDNDVFASVIDGHAVTWDERKAYYHVVNQAWDLSRTAPEQPAVTVTQFNLFSSPKTYRGRLLRVEGSLLRVRAEKFDPDPARPDRPREYYECAIRSAETAPFIVLTFENPIDNDIMPHGDGVWTDAYFFKIWGYNDDKMQAPLLMGYRLHRLSVERPLASTAGVVLGAFVLLIALVWFFLSRGRRKTEELRRRISRELAEDVDIPEPAALPRDTKRDGNDRVPTPPGRP